MSTRLTCWRSTIRDWSRTTSMSAPRHKLRVLRSTCSPDPTIRASAPGPEGVVSKAAAVDPVEDDLLHRFETQTRQLRRPAAPPVCGPERQSGAQVNPRSRCEAHQPSPPSAASGRSCVPPSEDSPPARPPGPIPIIGREPQRKGTSSTNSEPPAPTFLTFPDKKISSQVYKRA
jgi:hypothetical protein